MSRLPLSRDNTSASERPSGEKDTERAAVSALVNTLERAGLASRRRADHDGRAIALTLTPAGRDTITEAFRAHNQREQAWAATLTETEHTTLVGLLEKLMAGATTATAKRRR